MATLEEECEVPIIPYLPPIMKDREYTLVLDLDETLIHYEIDES
jgi:predicted enzyme involved in methoxymalonyl-ACP biosynthesis